MKPASVARTRVAWVECGMKLKEAGESKGEMQIQANARDINEGQTSFYSSITLQ